MPKWTYAFIIVLLTALLQIQPFAPCAADAAVVVAESTATTTEPVSL
jgi:hypothetical protein